MGGAPSSVKSNFGVLPGRSLGHDELVSKNEHDARPDLLDVASFRRDYHHAELRRDRLRSDPVEQFHDWIKEADACPAILESTAMALSTASPGGEVSSRMVLLKGYGTDGFRFFTNTESRKASQIASNGSVSLLFYWEALERQIQINGKASLLPASETETYFSSRPRGSRIGAWASRQSEVIENRGYLERRVTELETRFEGKEVPTPSFWSGYLVVPETIEFWQGRPNRLHDRFRYRRDTGGWIIERISP